MGISLKTWSKTQTLIARSSGEAELYGTIRGACEGLGIQSLFQDFNEHVDIQVFLDANAAKGIIERKGLSKVRHLDVEHLWLQQEQSRRLLPLFNVGGTLNVADLMTTYLPEREIQKCMTMFNMEMSRGRARIAADLHHVRRRKCGDSWDQRGRKGTWRRAHLTRRRSLFTPMKIPGGLRRGGDLLERRLTDGVKKDGSKFTIDDNWKDPRRAHVLLPFEWRGHSTFFGKDVFGVAKPDATFDTHDIGIL